MAMNLGGGGGKAVTPQMNVTPLVDVVLVLLIIFMVITPLLTKTFWIHTPKQDQEEVKREDLQQDPTPPLVLHVGAGRSILINGASDDAEYGFAVKVMDKAREGGAVTIAALTQALAAPAGDAGAAPAAASP